MGAGRGAACAPLHRRRRRPARRRACPASGRRRRVHRGRRRVHRLWIVPGRLSQPGGDDAAVRGRDGGIAVHRLACGRLDARRGRRRRAVGVRRRPVCRARSGALLRRAAVRCRRARRRRLPGRSARRRGSCAARLRRRPRADRARRRAVAAAQFPRRTDGDRTLVPQPRGVCRGAAAQRSDTAGATYLCRDRRRATRPAAVRAIARRAALPRSHRQGRTDPRESRGVVAVAGPDRSPARRRVGRGAGRGR